jgi:two-component system KDP operon response regulator KdpE
VTAILVVDSTGRSSTALAQALRAAAYELIQAYDGLEALRLFYQRHPDVVLVGTQIPKLDALELVHVLRAISSAPILLLADVATVGATVRALDAGADDVVNRSTAEEEVLARIRASLRRATRRSPEPQNAAVVRTGDVLIDRPGRLVLKRGTAVSLTQTEFRLLDALASRLGQVAPHRFLLSTVWGDSFIEDTHYLRMYIGYLRTKLEDDPAQPRYLRNEWGVGYRLAAVPPGATPASEDGDEFALGGVGGHVVRIATSPA